MFGQYGGNFWAGALERKDSNRRKRRELAQAFETFKQNNPEATMADFQSFIEQQAGNDLYLRGAFPSDKVLEAAARQGEERKRQRVLQQNLDNIASRAQVQGQLDAMVDEALLREDDNNRVLQEVKDALGPDAVDMMNVGNLDSRRQNIRNRQARQLLPDAMDLIQKSNGQIKPADLQGMYPNLNRNVLERTVELAQTQWEQAQSERRRRIYNDELQRGLQLAQQGLEYTPSKEAQDILLPEQRGEIDKLAQRKTEEYNRRIEQENNQAYDRWLQSVKGDQQLLTMALDPSIPQSEVRKALASRAQRVIGGVSNERIEETVEELYAAAAYQQRQAQDQRRTQYLSEGQEMADGQVEQMQENVRNAFGDPQKGTTPLAGDSMTATLAVNQLAQRYFLSDRAQSAIAEKLQSGDFNEDATPAQIANEIAQDPNISPLLDNSTITEHRTNQATRLAQQYGNFKVQTTESYIQEEKSGLETTRKQFDNELSRIEKLDSPLQRQRQLQSLRMQLARSLEDFRTEVQQRVRNASKWVQPGGQPFDPEMVRREVLQPNFELVNELDRRIQALIAQAEADFQAEGDPSAERPAPQSNTQYGPNAQAGDTSRRDGALDALNQQGERMQWGPQAE